MRFLKLLQSGAAAALLLSGAPAKATPEQEFWKWFQKNEGSLYDFERDQEHTFDQLSVELHKLNPDLTFEFGPKENGRREFTIGADGIRAAFPEVEKLYAAAPLLPRWRIQKFRQRRPPSDISYGGLTVKAAAVSVLVEPNGTMADLTVFVPGYTQVGHKAYAPIVYLLLDEALGEYDVETRVGGINIKAPEEASGPTCSLADLPKRVDALFAKK